MSSEDRIQKIKEILEAHQGKNSQISSGEIGRQVGIDEDATHVSGSNGLCGAIFVVITIGEHVMPIKS